jgi:outer membrane biosynthesis protein TonB
LFTRKNTSVSLFREACRAELRSGKHAARRALLRKPSRTTVIAGVVAAGIIGATVGGTASSWASAVGPAATGTHAAAVPGGAAANSKVNLAADAVRPTSSAVPHAVPAKVAHAAKHAVAVKPAAHSKPAAKPKAAATAKPKVPAKPKPAAKPKPKKPSGPTKPYQIYDSVTPAAIPGGRSVATYANGPYQASWADVSGRGDVLWIDVQGNNLGANALDVEPGDATPAGAAAWVKAKLEKYPDSKPIVYTMRSWWPAVTASMNTLPGWMHSHVKYWIADPTGYEHILPGADATQWYWGKSVDITTAKPGFWK